MSENGNENENEGTRRDGGQNDGGQHDGSRKDGSQNGGGQNDGAASAGTSAAGDAERVVRNDERERYELWRGNTLVGVADVREMGGATVFTHTGIRPEYQGAGAGSTLVQAALEDTVARGEKIVAGCSFVADFVAENHEFDAHLVSPDTLR